jgi:hypothetical protein
VPATYDLTSIASGERWLPLVPHAGLEPHENLRPNLAGGHTAELGFTLGSITTGETWPQPTGPVLSFYSVTSIPSGESWLSAPGLVPAVGLVPHAGLHPHGSGISWAWIFYPASIESGETWGGTDFTTFAARVFSKLALPSAIRRRVRFSA